jgi:hypothetical protein
MDSTGQAWAGCILGLIAMILAIFIGQHVANYFAFTGIMWWVVAFVAYFISGSVMVVIIRHITGQ